MSSCAEPLSDLSLTRGIALKVSERRDYFATRQSVRVHAPDEDIWHSPTTQPWHGVDAMAPLDRRMCQHSAASMTVQTFPTGFDSDYPGAGSELSV